MRKLTVESLQFSFKGKASWNIKPMIKMKKVSIRCGKKKVSEFYGELVEFENLGLYLMLPANEVVSFIYPSSKLEYESYEQLRLLKASEGLKIKEADFFMGKCPVILYNPLELQGSTAVLMKFKEM